MGATRAGKSSTLNALRAFRIGKEQEAAFAVGHTTAAKTSGIDAVLEDDVGGGERGRGGRGPAWLMRHGRMCVCVWVGACVRACVRARARVCNHLCDDLLSA